MDWGAEKGVGGAEYCWLGGGGGGALYWGACSQERTLQCSSKSTNDGFLQIEYLCNEPTQRVGFGSDIFSLPFKHERHAFQVPCHPPSKARQVQGKKTENNRQGGVSHWR